jgi:hypothetical protein
MNTILYSKSTFKYIDNFIFFKKCVITDIDFTEGKIKYKIALPSKE